MGSRSRSSTSSEQSTSTTSNVDQSVSSFEETIDQSGALFDSQIDESVTDQSGALFGSQIDESVTELENSALTALDAGGNIDFQTTDLGAIGNAFSFGLEALDVVKSTAQSTLDRGLEGLDANLKFAEQTVGDATSTANKTIGLQAKDSETVQAVVKFATVAVVILGAVWLLRK